MIRHFLTKSGSVTSRLDAKRFKSFIAVSSRRKSWRRILFGARGSNPGEKNYRKAPGEHLRALKRAKRESRVSEHFCLEVVRAGKSCEESAPALLCEPSNFPRLEGGTSGERGITIMFRTREELNESVSMETILLLYGVRRALSFFHQIIFSSCGCL